MALTAASVAVAADMPATGWLNWRGPQQVGVSMQIDLPEQIEPGSSVEQWSIDLPGRGTPVIAQYPDGARMYVWGYAGEGIEQHEVLLALDPATGDELWRRKYPDFLSDVIYERYSIGSPTVDAETGRVYMMTTPGLLVCVDRDGKPLWEVSMLEQFGRLTFPNGRTGAPAVDGDLVIVNAISSNWGTQGPARNRFYAFDKKTGMPVWSSDPGVGPPFLKDSSFCTPVFANEGDKRVFYAALGDGNIVCVNARTGEPIWRYQLAIGGANSSVVLTDDAVIAVHGKENVDDTGRGRMVALKRDATPEPDDAGRPTLGADDELWRNDQVSMFTSSPTLANGRVYQLTMNGELFAIDPATGKTIWRKKLANSTLHGSPLYADGKLYLPTWKDGLFIVKDTGDAPEILDHVELEGDLIGSPSVYAGRLFVHTTEKLYCFAVAPKPLTLAQEAAGGLEAIGQGLGNLAAAAGEEVADVVREQVTLRALPDEILLRPGQRQPLTMQVLDQDGRVIDTVDAAKVNWAKWIPPTAKVRAELNADFDGGAVVAGDDAKYSAGSIRGEHDLQQIEFDVENLLGDPRKSKTLADATRGRILPSVPFGENFESFELDQADDAQAKWAYPPLPWIGARFKWEIREDPTDANNKVLAKTLDRVLFMRSMVFFGHSDESDYVIQADVMSDGNRRQQSTPGVICQRYIICLDGNAQQLRVYSNIENFNRARDLGQLESRVDFPWQVGTWYTLKATVETGEGDSGVIKAKAWPRGEAEPDAWTIEVPVPLVHENGAPGLFGLSPQSGYKVYIDNIQVSPRD